MPEFTVHLGSGYCDAEVMALYTSVGWTSYTDEPAVLLRALYVALGSTEGSDFKPEPLRMFALFR